MPNIGVKGGRTEIESDAVRSAVSELPNVETDLGEIKQKLDEVSEPLEDTWVGTARASYIKAAYYMQQQLAKIKTGIGGLYDITIQTCDDRVTLDQEVAGAATIH
ncbi:MAG: hypothetical protein Q4D94_05550 [Bacillota bacterium]|nr:hypothetical protein [Bacillota bacterium]